MYLRALSVRSSAAVWIIVPAVMLLDFGDAFRRADDADEPGIGRPVFFHHRERLDRRPAGGEHRVNDVDVESGERRKFAIVAAGFAVSWSRSSPT
jgi:hypothetical protein